MKKISFLLAFIIISTISIFGQQYYYYYDGKKQPLELDTEHIYVVTDNPQALKENTLFKSVASVSIHSENKKSNQNLKRKRTYIIQRLI